ADKALGDEAAFAGLAVRIAALFSKRGILAVEHLNAVIAAVADVNPAVIGDLHAVHRISEERGLLDALGGILRPGTGRGGCGIVDRIASISAEMTDICRYSHRRS